MDGRKEGCTDGGTDIGLLGQLGEVDLKNRLARSERWQARQVLYLWLSVWRWQQSSPAQCWHCTYSCRCCRPEPEWSWATCPGDTGRHCREHRTESLRRSVAKWSSGSGVPCRQWSHCSAESRPSWRWLLCSPVEQLSLSCLCTSTHRHTWATTHHWHWFQRI